METRYISLDKDKKKLYSPHQIPPLGEPLSIESPCYWFTPPLHPAMWDPQDSWACYSLPQGWYYKYSISMLRFARMYNSSQLSFETLKNLCGAQDARCYAIEEQPSVGRNRHMGSSLRESFPMSEQLKYILAPLNYLSKWMKHFFVLQPTWGIQRRLFRKSHFLALDFQESCLVVKVHTS